LSEPASSEAKPGNRTADDRQDHGEALPASSRAAGVYSAPAIPIPTGAAGRLKSPPYLLTTHLRF